MKPAGSGRIAPEFSRQSCELVELLFTVPVPMLPERQNIFGPKPPVRAGPDAGYAALVHKPDEVLAGHIQEVCCLLGSQFTTGSDDRDRFAPRKGIGGLLQDTDDG